MLTPLRILICRSDFIITSILPYCKKIEGSLLAALKNCFTDTRHLRERFLIAPDYSFPFMMAMIRLPLVKMGASWL